MGGGGSPDDFSTKNMFKLVSKKIIIMLKVKTLLNWIGPMNNIMYVLTLHLIETPVTPLQTEQTQIRQLL